MISGFMVVRDVESQGYPFVEAAAAALAVCDELLISDGYSTDRTWEGLLALREAFGNRVQLFRDRWPGPGNREPVLADATNVVRRRCRGEWCLSVQANEVIHERSAPAIRALPERYPHVEIFRLPYLLLMGPDLVTGTDLRRRLFRNIPDIVAISGACEVAGVIPVRPVPALLCDLPEPVYRYRAMFPEGYLAKLRGISPRTTLWDLELQLAEEAFATAAGVRDPIAAFWELVCAFLGGERWLQATAGTGWPRGPLHAITGAPAAARHLIGRPRYELDASLTWLAGLVRRDSCL